MAGSVLDDGATGADVVHVPIVGIGASAGGLEAFTQLLRGVPADTGLAFVLVQHLAPNYESMLADLVSKATPLPVVEVTEGVRVLPDHVYVIPPNKTMCVADGMLHLEPRAGHAGIPMPIDRFFESLARENRSQAIGVVLSGTASDGALGLKAIKAEGGITLVQDPATARYDGMARAAIAAGAVDFIVPLERLGEEIAKVARHPYIKRPELPETPAAVEEDEALRRIFARVRMATGVDLTYYKRATISRRLRRRLVLHRLERLTDYVRLLQHDPQEVDALCQDVFIHVTGFFRDPEVFEALQADVFPGWFKTRSQETPIRVWICGCSTGEEAYSYAIALLESLGTTAASQPPIQIFATDVSAQAVDRARAGFYPESIAAEVSSERLRRFFQQSDGGYRINKPIRDMCVFARQDVTRDPPFSKVDLVSCRNLLIYLEPILQRRVLSVFHYALNPDGCLVLGTSETIGSSPEMFRLADKRSKIYVRKATGLRNSLDFRSASSRDAAGEPRRALVSSHPQWNLQQHVERLILDEYSPAGVVINDDMQILHVRGDTGRFLQPARGDATLNLLKMAREGLMLELRTAIHSARRTDAPVRKSGVSVRANGRASEIDLEVVPLPMPGTRRHFLVLFRDANAATPAAARTAGRKLAAKPSLSRQRIEEELVATRDYLQSIIQDQEATNEELQSANEEILSSNEELQSTNEELETAKEELQSTNEELNTVNEELQTRNQELGLVNSDLTNLLASVQMPIIMVANDLRIRRFTPMVERIFNIIPRDVDRPIGDFQSNLQLPNLERLIRDSIDTVSVRELEVQDREGRWYSMRVRPYKNVDNRIDGAVITFVDIDAIRRGMHVEDHSGVLLDAVTRVAGRPLVVLGADLRVRTASPEFYRAFQLSPQESRGQQLYDLGDGCWQAPRVRTLFEKLLATQDHVEDYPVTFDRPGGPTRWVLDAVAVGTAGERSRLVFVTCTPSTVTTGV